MYLSCSVCSEEKFRLPFSCPMNVWRKFIAGMPLSVFLILQPPILEEFQSPNRQGSPHSSMATQTAFTNEGIRSWPPDTLKQRRKRKQQSEWRRNRGWKGKQRRNIRSS